MLRDGERRIELVSDGFVCFVVYVRIRRICEIIRKVGKILVMVNFYVC